MTRRNGFASPLQNLSVADPGTGFDCRDRGGYCCLSAAIHARRNGFASPLRSLSVAWPGTGYDCRD